jgi:hypothetical protein
MAKPKDRTGALLRKCLRTIKTYHGLAIGGGWEEAPELAALITEIEKTLVYRAVSFDAGGGS